MRSNLNTRYEFTFEGFYFYYPRRRIECPAPRGRRVRLQA
jgi:hypothetical protein